MTPIEAAAILRKFSAVYAAWRCAEDTIASYADAWQRAPFRPMLAAADAWIRGNHAFPPAPGQLLAQIGLADPDRSEPLPPYLAHPWGSLQPAEWIDRARLALELAKDKGDPKAIRHWSRAVRERERIVAEHAPRAITAGEAKLLRSFGADQIGGPV